MNENTSRTLDNGLLITGLLCFVGGAALLVTGSPAEITIYALGALGLIFVGTGAAVKKPLLTQSARSGSVPNVPTEHPHVEASEMQHTALYR